MPDRQKALIIGLIKSDLVNYKFMDGLENLGLTPSSYYLDLAEPILILMGFTLPDQDKVYQQYSRMKSQVLSTDIHNAKKTYYLAKRIYFELYKIKR